MVDMTAHQHTVINQLASDHASVGVRPAGDSTDSIYADCYETTPGVCSICGQDENMHISSHEYVMVEPVITYRVAPSGWKQRAGGP